LAEYNLRVIVSRSGTVNPNAEVFQRKFSPTIVLTTHRATAASLKELRAAATEVKICGAREINFRRALGWLRAKWGVQRLLCEGGGELNDAMFRSSLISELHLTICPKIFGGRSAPTIADGLGAGALARAARLELTSAQRRGDEMYLVYRVARRDR
jgi:riboflavin-specific deaminase-like protein